MTTTESGRVQVVYTANVGSPLTVDVAAGATVITVDDTSDFDTDGTLQIAGETIDYSAVDDDTGQVTLDWAVTGAAEAGDPVTLWDTGLDLAAVEYRAHVALPGVLDNADAVDATIRHTLIGYLAEGIRTPGTGESVRLERHGLDWVVVDLLGKQPILPSNVVTGSQSDPATSITATTAGPGDSHAGAAGDIAIGGDAIALGGSGTPPLPGATSAIAIGLDSYANSHSVAVGEAASADVAGVTVGSSVAHDLDPGQTAVGHDLTISAPFSTVVGYQGQSGDYGTSTAGAGSVALGAYAKARKDNSVALGRQADANAAGAVAIGCDSSGAAAAATTADDFALGTAAHKVKVAGRLNVAQRTPSDSADTQGAVGDITTDGSYVYVKTLAGWKRVAIATFAAAPGAATGTASMSLAATGTATVGPAAATGTAAMTLAATATGRAPATSSAALTLAAAGTAAFASGYPTAVLADSPAVYCRLDDTSGNFTDSSGNGRNATVTGTPTYVQPPAGTLINGSSVTFSGSQYGDLGATTYFDSLTALTVEAWFKTTDTGANINIVGRDNASGATFRGWRLRMVSGKLNCLVFGNVSTSLANFNSPLSYNDGNWHHAVLTAANSGSAFLYVDGAQVATAAMAFTMAVSNIVGEHAFIGASHNGGGWIGSLDEVAIYTTALSSTRVLAHYNAGH